MTSSTDFFQKKKLYDYLSQYISDNKRHLFEQNIQHRTRYLTVVLENLFQSHNASAVLRTCDCFGIQDIHAIENTNHFEVNADIALGASKWLTINKHNEKDQNNTLNCYERLRKQGYKIIATTPHTKDCTIEKLKLNQKTALIFGTELEGLSKTAIDNADGYVKIPMYGFTESFNISVSASIFLFYLTQKLKKSKIDWKLSEKEMLDIKIDWVKSVVKKPELIIERFLQEQ